MLDIDIHILALRYLDIKSVVPLTNMLMIHIQYIRLYSQSHAQLLCNHNVLRIKHMTSQNMYILITTQKDPSIRHVHIGPTIPTSKKNSGQLY